MKTRLLFFAFILMGSSHSWAQSITINESAGWLESAYVKWQPIDSAKSYNIYYSGEGITDQKIDNQLIRSYGTYYRADVLGLKAGTYTIKLAPVIAGVEGTATQTGNITVLAHDRSGFAFNGGSVPGAYKADGTPKDGAVILYITENSKNKISLNVTGANANPCVGLEAIMEAYGKGKDTRPLIVRLIGNITDLTTMADGDILIEDNQNPLCYITVEGVGDDAVCNGWSFRVKDATNVEIRNLGAMNCNSTAGDDFGLQQDNDHIWVHNCDMFYGDAGSDADQIKGDGALDCKGSTFCTFSYNHFWDNGKSNLLGLSEDSTTGLYVTYHHNWYDHCDSRHPRVRFYSVHFYNNYLDGISKYGAGSTMGSSLFVEGNYYRNCKHPMMTSMQGTDVWNESTQMNDPNNMGTFSGEDGGTIKAFNNTFDASVGTNNMRFVAYGDPNPDFNIAGVISSTTDFDAYVAQTRGELVPDTVKSFQGANVYNNFDTDANLYVKNLVIDDPAIAMGKDTTYAGRVNGGDLTWKFNNVVDDASYLVDVALKAALTNYKTTLVFVQGDSTNTTPKDTVPQDTVINPAADVIHNFTLSGKSSTFFTITGNLSTSKGTVYYAGLTLTQCLKIESTTSISFTITQAATLTLVFNETFAGKINVNGNSYSATAGIVTVPLASGSYAITKVDVANLYYMSIVYSSNTAPTITATAPAARCDSGIVTLGATASSGTINWYAATTGGTLLGTGTTFTTPGISATTSYFVDATANGHTTATRTEIIASVNTTPTINVVAPAARCDAGTVNLSATASAGTINWYATDTGGTSLGTGDSFITPGISSTTSYFADATANSCTTGTRTEIVATVYATPAITAIAPSARCDAGTVNLSATASVGTINWYATDTGGTSLGTGNSFTTPGISSTTSYFADATANSCTTGTRTEIVATVYATPAITATAPAARCDAGTVNLSATASTGTINWYATDTGGTSLGTGDSFITPGISSTTSYFADATANSCTTGTRTEIVAIVNTTPTITATAPATRYDAGTVILGATASAGTINWYTADTGGTLLGSGDSFTTPSISATTSYFVDATLNSCTTSTRTEIIATVYTTPIDTTGSSLKQNTGTAVLSLCPIPVTGNLNISSGIRVEKVEIYSMTGVLVKSTGKNINTIDMNHINQGCYLVQVFTEHGVFKRTIIKK